jgi:uncharacterized protein with PIN domain
MKNSSRFLLDGMLGSLARWLRICGYEASFMKDTSDDELIRRALEEDLILLSRDKQLYRKAQKAGLRCLLIHGDDSVKRLAHVSRRYNLNLTPTQSRCPNCGILLRKTDKRKIEARVPPRTYQAYDDFWFCKACGKTYWQGSHWRSIVNTVCTATKFVNEVSEQDL